MRHLSNLGSSLLRSCLWTFTNFVQLKTLSGRVLNKQEVGKIKFKESKGVLKLRTLVGILDKITNCLDGFSPQIFRHSHGKWQSPGNIKQMFISPLSYSILLRGINIGCLMNNPITQGRSKISPPLFVLKTRSLAWNWFWIILWKVWNTLVVSNFSLRR